ncbi:NAD(P)H-binding protein [Flavobacterium agricola]|uniref:NAD(P)H-binding protein n=1 Tax=Flavobacterium agricola TaxID=2870839 RepID=A0ABY6LYH3_9FLAO|nr:NAD(P)H-binding protein [Flavobacterium agricola]UYW01384.1 NAD(P)H-binding protein [Flavobacterium agricola]
MKALVLGATGATGQQLVQQLLQNPDYEQVLVVVRKASFKPEPKLTELVVTFDELQNYKEHFVGDVAFSCLGTTLKAAGSKEAQWLVDYEYQYEFASLCAANQVSTFVLVSAVGAKADSAFFYNNLKGSLEDAVKKLLFTKTIIFQPAGLIRPNSDRMGEKVFIRLTKIINAFGLLLKYKPVTTANLAQAMQNAVLKQPNGISTIGLSAIYNLL